MASPEAAYLPDEKEIYRRAHWMRWMARQGWDDAINLSMMLEDHPSIELVERVVKRHGLERGREIIEKLMA